MIFAGAPGEIIVYADSDVLFSPGWLARSVELLETFPNVGMVTARPFRTNPDFYSQTAAWGQQDPQVRLWNAANSSPGRPSWIRFEPGQSEDEIREHYEKTEDVRLTYQGYRRWQVLPTGSSRPTRCPAALFPFDMDRPMGQVKQLDQRMNEAGLLRLMVTDPLAMNMSNTLRGVSGQAKAAASTAKTARLIDLPLVKAPLLRLYDEIFRWYYDR